MPRKKIIERIIILTAVLAVLCLMGYFVKVDYKIKTIARVFPSKELYIIRDGDMLVNRLNDYKTNETSNISGIYFSRGDVMDFSLAEGINNGESIKAGSTVFQVNSFITENKLSELDNQLKEARALLESEISGDKSPVIAKAQQTLEQEKAQLKLAEIEYQRAKDLFDKEVLPIADFEIKENNYKLAKIKVEIASQDLTNSRTGSKPEQIRLINTQIESIEEQIVNLKAKKQRYNISTPISGIMSFTPFTDTLVTIHDTSEIIVSFPIKLKDDKYLKTGARLEFPEHPELEGVCFNKGFIVKNLGRDQFFLAKAVIRKGKENLRLEQTLGTYVFCDRINIFEFLSRKTKLLRVY